MVWTKYLLTLVLAASVSRLGISRAVHASTPSCADEFCSNGASHDLPSDLLPRLDRFQDHDLSGITTHWSRREHQSLPRVAALALPKEPEPVAPKPVSPATGPSHLDGPSTEPASNPAAGLDPTKPKVSEEPSASPTSVPSQTPSPSIEPDPNHSVLQPVSADDPFTPVPQPTTVSDAAGCGLKRSDGPCPGPSDNIGDDVPGQAPDAVAATRAGRPVDDDAVAYDYLLEVQSERGTGLVNDKLANLQSRIATDAPDDPVRTDEINNNFVFGSTVPLVPVKLGDEAPQPFEFDDVFNFALDHGQFPPLLSQAGVTLSDTRGFREALTSNGATQPTLKWSWSGDQKVAFTDWSYKKKDTSAMSPKAHYTELTMALFKAKGVDTSKIDAIAQTRIANTSTEKTIDSIFESFGMPRKFGNPNNNVVVLRRSDTDPAKKEAFDAYFRTANGKGTVNLLAFHANDWGSRSPDILFCKELASVVQAITRLSPLHRGAQFLTLANVPKLAARAGGETVGWGDRLRNLLSVLYSVMNPYCPYSA
ncbi:uncharacterized protein A1O5_03103 [Cladophialophora psammophila CBS 110553]|uniref:Uncharacterized protein n=1 Tax=Cladophialophora psammophila CBS 110553 TaxID=1182543 RepID=W9WZK5_9EURO|nr:uncharacterized protein A1O5_03103 [Cladophialophora psammophila CBS 110553]EXJ73343.1 hypothetical protein A1O5_03103 [Cladophialophora psammophila CBS 110553]